MAENFLSPQPGFQTKFLCSPADIVIGGGAAGAGKTFALLLEPLRWAKVKGFGGIIFRRTYPQITHQGGLWDTAMDIYPTQLGVSNESQLEWTFPSGVRIKFNHLQHEKNILDYQGSQIPFIAFDELTHFTEKMFWYLLSRNRSVCGVQPYVRATCNPDPDSWVARLIEWWIDQDTGFPIPDRAGVVRFFTRDNGVLVWGNSKEEVIAKCPHLFEAIPIEDKNMLVKSLTFIPGNIYENPELIKKNPQYLGDLMAQDEATKKQLLEGNWKIKVDSESMMQYTSVLDMFTNDHVKANGKRYITADIALHGSDKFVLWVWEGWRIIDLVVMEKKDAFDVEAKIKEVARKYGIPQSRIAYDADGIGAFLKGYLRQAVSFNNGATAIKEKGKNVNYKNLKTQCYYLLAEKVNAGEIFVVPTVAEQKINNKFVKDYITEQSRVIKRFKSDADGKLQIIPKEQMKNILGCSPDFMDAMMMRVVFDLKPVAFQQPKISILR